jgi:beta-amylase
MAKTAVFFATFCSLATVFVGSILVQSSGSVAHRKKSVLRTEASILKDRRLRGGCGEKQAAPKSDTKIPAFLMMPLDTINATSGALSSEAIELIPEVAGVKAEGIMVDVWWGLCEPQPGVYDFSGYVELLRTCKQLNLKVQAVMSFHACGGNIGDSVNIPLPAWITELEANIPELFYRDQRNDPSREYISLSCDHLAVFPRGNSSSAVDVSTRTALECYEDFMRAFADATREFAADGTLAEIQVLILLLPSLLLAVS